MKATQHLGATGVKLSLKGQKPSAEAKGPRTDTACTTQRDRRGGLGLSSPHPSTASTFPPSSPRSTSPAGPVPLLSPGSSNSKNVFSWTRCLSEVYTSLLAGPGLSYLYMLGHFLTHSRCLINVW